MTDNVVILPGEAAFVIKAATISTLLGSCVAVCLYDCRNKWGGMNHFLLPCAPNSTQEPLKFGDTATMDLIARALEAGSRRADLVASVFGGGRVVGNIMADAGQADVGARNIAVARALLAKNRIPVVQEEVGGARGLRIHMDTVTNVIRWRAVRALARRDK